MMLNYNHFSFCFLLCYYYSNKYINANFLAGHFEVIAIPALLITLTTIIKNKPFYMTLIPFSLSLGVRQDVGFFLFFQLLSLLFVPKYIFALSKKTKINIFIYMGLCLIYVYLSLKYFLPYMGASQDLKATQFWSQWGNSWGDIAMNAFKHPLLVMHTILSVGFTNFNEAFFYLGIFNPFQWFFVQAPAVLFYLASTMDKNYLFWYNSAFLLPGVYISTYVGFFIAAKFLLKYKNKYCFSALIIVLLTIISIVLIKSHRAVGTDDYRPKKDNKIDYFNQILSSEINRCDKKPDSFSTDISNYVFLNNQEDKYLVDHYYKSQIVIFSKLNRGDFQSNEDFNKYNKIINLVITNDKNYMLLHKDKVFSIYVEKSAINCGINKGVVD
ncbi:MAG: hypothetical protein V4591_08865 [Bdellovibrionota bacterium]